VFYLQHSGRARSNYLPNQYDQRPIYRWRAFVRRWSFLHPSNPPSPRLLTLSKFLSQPGICGSTLGSGHIQSSVGPHDQMTDDHW